MRRAALCCLLLAVPVSEAALFGRPKLPVASHRQRSTRRQKSSHQQQNLRKVPKVPRKRKRKFPWPWRKKQKPRRRIVVLRDRICEEGVVLRDRIREEGALVPKRLRGLVEFAVAWWRTDATVDERWYNRVLFLGSNAAYFIAGAGLLSLTKRRVQSPPPLLAWLMFAAGGYSTTYHAMQCVFGCDSDQARATGRADVFFAMMSACYFFLECGCRGRVMQSLAAVSLACFADLANLGYTASHSLWHLFGAALAYAGGVQWTREGRKIMRSRSPAAPPPPPPPSATLLTDELLRRQRALRRTLETPLTRWKR